MYRIYLDQKDYIRIAYGLLGKDRYQEDYEVYNYLLSKVESEDIRIYYSSMHLEEVADYCEEGSTQFDKYIEAITNLTDGNCIVSSQDILKREIKLFIGKTYGFNSEISEQDYPYGIMSEAIIAEIPLDYVFGHPLTNNKKKDLRKKLSRLTVKEISNLFPGSEYMNKSDFIDALTGSYLDIRRVNKIRTYFDGIMEIERYLKKYRNLLSGKLTPQIDKQTNLLLELIADHRAEMEKENGTTLDDDGIRTLTLDSILTVDGMIFNFVRQICQENKLDFADVYLNLKDSYSKNLFSLECQILILIEYFNKHRDKRKPDKNDYHDMNHMKFLPYVDFYVCERFFAELSRKIAPKFDTTVFRNLKELRECLETIV